jgi:hypothetical protein
MDEAREFFERVRSGTDPVGHLEPGPMADWEVFPYEREGLRPKVFETFELPEPTSEGACPICEGVDDSSRRLWTGRRLALLRTRATSVLFQAQVVSLAHEGLEDLDVSGHEELGRLLGAAFNAMRGLAGVGRVHINKWENGRGHLMVAMYARPEGVLQLRGSNLPIWADMLPSIPDEDFAARAREVSDAVADALESSTS